MNKYHLKFIKKYGNLEVWLVDGEIIRKNLDIDFTNYGQHYRFPFIPINELWVDKETTSTELDFYIIHLLEEHKLMSKGMSYDNAIDKADLKERSERFKFENKKIVPRLLKDHRKFQKSLLLTLPNNIPVYIVYGREVRTLLDIDFTEGGHDLVYDFVPTKTIWIDDALLEKERLFVILHEAIERTLMSKGMLYKFAHNTSSKIEYELRNITSFSQLL